MDLYIFIGVTISCLCTRAQDGRFVCFYLEKAMVDFYKASCESGLESLSFQSTASAEFIQQAGKK